MTVHDTLALTYLICTPASLLLVQYYSIRPTTMLFTLSANLISIAAPFALLRPASPVHRPSKHGNKAVAVPNRSIISDYGTFLASSGLATAILAVLLELSFATFLPVHLVTHFTGIRNLTFSHRGAAGLPPLLVGLFPAGVAAYEFLFVPSTAAAAAAAAAAATTATASSQAASSSSSSAVNTTASSKKTATKSSHDNDSNNRESKDGHTGYSFDPATATLRQHLYHNAWGWYTPRQKTLIGRTLLAMFMLTAETVIQVWGTIRGVELWGAACYAGIWAAGVGCTGLAFEWVGGPSD